MRSVSYKVGEQVTKSYASAVELAKKFKVSIITELTQIDETAPVDPARIAKVRKHFAEMRKKAV